MLHPLESIIAVQKKDRKLIKLMREIRDIPKRKSDIEVQLAGTERKLETALDSRKHTEVSLKDVELQVDTLNEQVTKYKQQQMDAQTNDQYRAFVKENRSGRTRNQRTRRKRNRPHGRPRKRKIHRRRMHQTPRRRSRRNCRRTRRT